MRIALVLMLLATAALGQTRPAAVQDYSKESYRLTSQADEIVAVLNNGLTVIAKRVQSPAVAIRAYAKTGGVYEGKWLGGGLSHLLEHLVAGGTTKTRSEEENRTLLQQIGNNSNAYTTDDHTCYYVNTTPQHLDEAVDLVAGWMLGAKITPEEYAREYEVVQRELEMNKGQPDRVFHHLRDANRYRVSPARVPVIGYQEVIQGLSRDDVYSYYQLAYQPNNLIFSVAGDVDPEVMLAAVKKQVAAAAPGREFSHELSAEPPVLAPRISVATFPKLGQAKLELGFPSIRLAHPDLYALDLLAAILGMGESSIFVEELRDKEQLVSAVAVGSYTPSYVEGTFSVMMELDVSNVQPATKAVLARIEKLKAEPLDEQRIARAKTQVRTSRVKSLQTAEQIASSLALDFITTGDPHFSDHYVDRIQAVTAAELKQVAQKYLDAGKLVTTQLLPVETAAAATQPTTQAAPAAENKVTRLELDNGMILLHKRIGNSPLVEVRMYAIGGLTAEDEASNGMGNLTMEMLPRGTKARSAQQIAEFFDSIGGDLQTACGNHTWYWNMTCMKEDLPRAAEVYADVVNNPAFPESEMSAVKQRIVAAIDSQDDDWHTQAMKFFRRSFFAPMNSPYQFLIAGQKQVVESATSEQMRQWYQSKVLGTRRVLAIYGDVDADTAIGLASVYFATGRKNPQPAQTSAPPQAASSDGPPSISVDRVEVQQTQQPLAGIVIGFQSSSVIGQPETFPLSVADTMTSGWRLPTGYLHETLRGRGLVYVVHATDFPGRSAELPGTFLVYAGCDPKNVNQVVDLILQSIARCQGTADDMQADWFARSKQLLATGQALENETVGEQASIAALDELYGLGYDYHDHFGERVEAVTLEQVRQVARSRLIKCVVTISTPQPDLVKRDTGVRTYETFPPLDLTPQGVQHEAVK